MPIKNLSEEVRMPRLGKIHLGIRVPVIKDGQPVIRDGKPVMRPEKTDYFVLDKLHSDYQKIVDLYGKEPKSLDIYIPVEDEETWAEQYYKMYDMTRGLICKGDGNEATRMLDVETGDFPNKNTKTVTMHEGCECLGKNCPQYKNKKCGEVMNLRFILPKIPGLGVWQIDTGSINSILNINSCAKMIKAAFGRISMVPLSLTLEPIDVNNPETGKKQKVFVLNLRSQVTLAQLADVAREQAKVFQLEAPDWEGIMEQKADDDIKTMYDNGEQKTTEAPIVIEQKPETSDEAFEKLETANKKTTVIKAPRDPLTIKSLSDLWGACNTDFKMQPKEVMAELGVNSSSDITELPRDCYKKIAELKVALAAP